MLLISVITMLLGMLAGCASTTAPHNVPLESSPPELGYRIGEVRRERSPESLMLNVSFSGGGTRAAALSYGVLEELAKTPVAINGKSVRMLDLVENISAVSGGSFTAAYYGLFGDRLFEDFETKFLKRDMEGEITTMMLYTSNLFRMTSPYFGRSDLLSEYFDEILFDGKTFSDLDEAVHREKRPFVLINATDISRASRFEFTQNQFDLLCSDIGPYKIARAVTASSASPLYFSPLTLSNYAGSCDYRRPEWLVNALNGDRHQAIRRYSLAADMQTYLDAGKRKYIHLLDGGLADNLGLRPILDRLTLMGPDGVADELRFRTIRRLVHIVVNAQTRRDNPALDQYAGVPNLGVTAFAIGNTTKRYNVETLAYARHMLGEAADFFAEKQKKDGVSEGEDVQAMLIELNFDDLESEAERAYFNSLPTSFSLPAEAVDRLREVGARLLRTSPDYQRLLRELPQLR